MLPLFYMNGFEIKSTNNLPNQVPTLYSTEDRLVFSGTLITRLLKLQRGTEEQNFKNGLAKLRVTLDLVQQSTHDNSKLLYTTVDSQLGSLAGYNLHPGVPAKLEVSLNPFRNTRIDYTPLSSNQYCFKIKISFATFYLENGELQQISEFPIFTTNIDTKIDLNSEVNEHGQK